MNHTAKPRKTAANHAPTVSKTMGVTVAKAAADTSMTDISHFDDDVIVSLGPEQTDIAATALQNAAEDHRERGLDMNADDAQQLADAVNAAATAFGSFSVRMKIRDAVDMHNFICGGGRASEDRRFNRRARDVAAAIDAEITEVTSQ